MVVFYCSNIQFALEPDSIRERVRVRFLFIGNSAEGPLGTVNRNEQRQSTIVVMVSCLLFCGTKYIGVSLSIGTVMVSCLLFCGTKVALCELDRHLYGALMAIAAYVRTGSLYTFGKA